VHVEGRIDPVSDVLTIDTELCLKDWRASGKRIDAPTALKGPAPKEEKATLEVCEACRRPGRGHARARAGAVAEERAALRELFLLTQKKVFYVANVAEKQLAWMATAHVACGLRAHAAKEGAPVVPSAPGPRPRSPRWTRGSAGLPGNPGPERARPAQRGAHRLPDPGPHHLPHRGRDECRAWTVKRGAKAPQAAGVIHTDFERGFIKAEVIWWEDLIKLGSEAACRQNAKLAIEGKDYVVRDGDVIHFKFNGHNGLHGCQAAHRAFGSAACVFVRSPRIADLDGSRRWGHERRDQLRRGDDRHHGRHDQFGGDDQLRKPDGHHGRDDQRQGRGHEWHCGYDR
jgi:hypothetical protein